MSSTPKPWKIQDNSGYLRNEIYGNGHIVAQVMYWMGSEDAAEVNANAHIIEAAPDLLDASERLIAYRDANTVNFQLEKADDFFRELRTAIRKARGER
jgi:hypothetical protein